MVLLFPSMFSVVSVICSHFPFPIWNPLLVGVVFVVVAAPLDFVESVVRVVDA